MARRITRLHRRVSRALIGALGLGLLGCSGGGGEAAGPDPAPPQTPPAGPAQDGTLPLVFTSDVYGDAFSAVAIDGVIAIKYDFDGDGAADTVFGFQRVG